MREDNVSRHKNFYGAIMKVALIADIQGNAVALETVLQRLEGERPDHIVCLGDVASGPEPVTVLHHMRRAGCLTVKGNMDDALLDGEPHAGTTAADRIYADMDRWSSNQLSRADRDYLSSFRLTIALDLGPTIQLLCCHGAPDSYHSVVDSMTPEQDLARMFAGHDSQLIATGHMHQPMLRAYHTQQIINPGSVGLPYGAQRQMPVIAQYAVITCQDEAYTITFHAVPYDTTVFKERVLASGMPHAGWFLSRWLL